MLCGLYLNKAAKKEWGEHDLVPIELLELFYYIYI